MKEGTCELPPSPSRMQSTSRCCGATTTRRPKQITVRAPRARAAAASYGVGKKIYNEAEQRRGERLLACCCVPDPRALFGHDRDGERDTGPAPLFLLSSARKRIAAGPGRPHGHCWAVRGRRSRSSPFSPSALAVCLAYCLHTVCRMGHWVGPLFTVDTHANAPGPPKSRNQKSLSRSPFIRQESERGSSRTRWRVVVRVRVEEHDVYGRRTAR